LIGLKGLKGYRLWAMGQLDSTCRAQPCWSWAGCSYWSCDRLVAGQVEVQSKVLTQAITSQVQGLENRCFRAMGKLDCKRVQAPAVFRRRKRYLPRRAPRFEPPAAAAAAAAGPSFQRQLGGDALQAERDASQQLLLLLELLRQLVARALRPIKRQLLAVAVQVDPFESKGSKPRNHLIGSRVETRRLQAMGPPLYLTAVQPLPRPSPASRLPRRSPSCRRPAANTPPAPPSRPACTAPPAPRCAAQPPPCST
jgi:hypothetical protein